jgi:hypothetical protein
MSAPVPMNMEEWQRRIRADKEKERQQKSQSAEILQSYRGGVKDEDLKLSALRQEEREKHLDAERLMHSYQNNERIEVRQRPVRVDPQLASPPVRAESDRSVNVTPGSVSAMAGRFAQVSDSDNSLSVSPSARTRKTVVAEALPPFGVTSLVEEGAAKETNLTNSTALSPVLDAFGTESQEYDQVALENAADLAAFSSATVPESFPRMIRLDVLISFGLVTSSENPILDGYVKAAGQIVQWRLTENSDLGRSVTYNTDVPAFIKKSNWDDFYVDSSGRSDVRRCVAVAAIPLFLTNGFPVDTVKDDIVRSLQHSIHSGEFVELAQAFR